MSPAIRRGDNGRGHEGGLGDEPFAVDVPARHAFRHSAARLQPLALADNLADLLRTLAPPGAVARWSVTGHRDEPIKIGGARLLRQGCYMALQPASGAVPWAPFAAIPRRIDRLRASACADGVPRGRGRRCLEPGWGGPCTEHR